MDKTSMAGSSKKSTTTMRTLFWRRQMRTVMWIGKTKRSRGHVKKTSMSRKGARRRSLTSSLKWEINPKDRKEDEGPSGADAAEAEGPPKEKRDLPMIEDEDIVQIIINRSIDISSSGFYAGEYLWHFWVRLFHFSDESEVFDPIDHFCGFVIVLIDQLDFLVDFEFDALDHLLLHIGKHLGRDWHFFPLQQAPVEFLKELVALYLINILHSQPLAYVPL